MVILSSESESDIRNFVLSTELVFALRNSYYCHAWET